MSGTYRAALAAEILKLRRSKVPPATLGAVSAAACVAALFMFILGDPDRARRLGLLNQKANLSGLTADWPGLLSFLTQMVAVGDLLLIAFVTTWVFGRESVDGTLRYLLALPVPRRSIVLAKFTVVAGWSVATNLWLAAMVLAVGRLMSLPGGTADAARHGLSGAALAGLLMLVATAPIALLASAGRGYLTPLAGALAALVLAQIAAALGWGGVIPWSVPAVAAGLAPGTELTAAGLLIVLLTGIAGVLGTVAWWRSGRVG